MSMRFIKMRFVSDIKKNEALKLQLAEVNDCKIATIDRWLRLNDESLTTYRNLEILKEYFGLLEVQELLEEGFIDAVDTSTR